MKVSLVRNCGRCGRHCSPLGTSSRCGIGKCRHWCRRVRPSRYHQRSYRSRGSNQCKGGCRERSWIRSGGGRRADLLLARRHLVSGSARGAAGEGDVTSTDLIALATRCSARAPGVSVSHLALYSWSGQRLRCIANRYINTYLNVAVCQICYV